MRLFSLLMVITFSLGLSVSAETLTLWNGHSLEHLKPELDRFTQQTGHTVVQQHFRADRFRDQVLSSVLLPMSSSKSGLAMKGCRLAPVITASGLKALAPLTILA